MLFDKSKERFEYVLVVRKSRIRRSFNEKVGQREGDYYFEIKKMERVTKTQIGTYLMLNCDILDKDGKSSRFLFKFLSGDRQVGRFVELLELLLSESKYRTPYKEVKAVVRVENEVRDPYADLKPKRCELLK